MADLTRDEKISLLETMRGKFKEGYTPDMVEKVLSQLEEVFDAEFRIVWDYFEEFEFGGGSDLFILKRTDGVAPDGLHDCPYPLWHFLLSGDGDPATIIDTFQPGDEELHTTDDLYASDNYEHSLCWDMEEDEEDDEPEGDDLCDLCMTSGVNVDRTTYCGKTIGIECGCNDSNEDGTCGDDDCKACKKAIEEEEE